MKITKKIVAILFCIITLISMLSPSALAWTSTEGVFASSKDGEDYVGYDREKYYYHKRLTHIIYDENGDIERYYSFTRTRPLDKLILIQNGEEKEAFCLEAGVSFSEADGGYVSKNYNNSSYFNNLSSEIRRGIMLALVYGWTNTVPDELKNKCNLDDLRLATQFIIWEYQQQLRTSPTELNSNNGIDADTFYHSLKNRSAEYAYDYILDKMSSHTTIPSFSSLTIGQSNTYTLRYNSSTKKYELTLIDDNNTLADVKIDNDDITVVRNENKYTFSSDKMITNAVTVTAQKNVNKTSDALLVWGMPGNQTMATGFSDPVRFFFKINTETYGILNLQKNSEDDNVSGINFIIEGNNLQSRTVTTNNDGTINVDNLLPGTYTITEQTDNKYETQASKTFTIKSGEITTVTFSNVLKRGNLTVTKTSEDGKVSEVKFHLYGTSLSKKEINEYAVTDENGTAIFNDILISDSEGYILEEVDTEIKYIVPHSQNITINWNEVTRASFENKLKRGSLKVIKTSEDNLVENRKFHLSGISLSGKNVDEYAITDQNRNCNI